MSEELVSRRLKIQGEWITEGAQAVTTVLGAGFPKVIIEAKPDGDNVLVDFQAAGFTHEMLSRLLGAMAEALAAGPRATVEDSEVSTETLPAPVAAVPQA